MRRIVNRVNVAITNVRQHNDDSGQGLAEYALILGLVALVCVGALGSLGAGIAASPGFTTLVGAL